MRSTPRLFFVLHPTRSAVPPVLARAFRHRDPRAALIGVRVCRDDMACLVECMRIMDVAGVYLHGGLERVAGKTLSRRVSGRVDVIIRRKKGFTGVDVEALVGAQKGNPLKKNGKTKRPSMGEFYQMCVEVLTETQKTNNYL